MRRRCRTSLQFCKQAAESRPHFPVCYHEYLQHPKLIAALSAALLVAAVADAKTSKRAGSSQPAKGGHAKAVRGKAGHGRQASAKRASASVRQAAPSRDRYVEIQQALADKGYYAGPVNGEWGSESVEALKRFQAEQKLVPDGKLGALSLIALGLGPNRDAGAELAARPATEPPAGP
jgi:peptidoglycan hydrolase-like protein with peptidoglycan-binding domain